VTTTPRAYQAAPHQFGPGKVHALEGDGLKTACGQLLSECPGCEVRASVNCRLCLRSLRSREERKAREAEWAVRSAQYQAEQERKNREWWERYDKYLASPEWLALRRAVLKRDGHLCQGCLQNAATQVHHLTYERVGDEMLFDLVSVCKACHEKIHAK
jgi:5-methylcytosine-specific restriction endonuclease McrA